MIKKKFWGKFWSLAHLNRAGLKAHRLYKLYCVLLRPIIEINAVVYHPMLMAGHSREFERLQGLVQKLCFGGSLRGLMSLEARRNEATWKLTTKLMGTYNRFRWRRLKERG